MWIKSTTNVDLATQKTLTSADNDKWIYLESEYTFTKDEVAIIYIAGYGSLGNFWIDYPTMYKDDIISQEGVLSDYWSKNKIDNNNYSISLGGGVTL